MSTTESAGSAKPALPIPFEELGGAVAVRALVERFYGLMDTEPEFAGIRRLHPPTLAGSIDKFYMFLSGWLGGPPLYVERYGHPMLRARHLPFSIGVSERDQWMACMTRAMLEVGVEERLRKHLLQALAGTADWMRNRPEPT
jgi:hemoglobin